MPTDDELSRLAEQALLREAQRGAVRAEVSGPSGWLRSRLPSTNKTFLHNTLLGALAANRVKEKEDKRKSESGKRKRQIEEQDRNTYKPLYIQASTKTKKPPRVTEKWTPGKDNNAKRTKKPKNTDGAVFVWGEEGLELTRPTELICNGKSSKNISDSRSSGKVLPRNIKFVSSKDNRTCKSNNR
ncbi:hypothetical protein Pmani_030902 [Petrolisthes manimaculis]|uniref:Uncharacterized protein n=1 Tax=Petrolisthes manimaculis TaxID=1843537 RepID=A0AAE1TVF3_9EUCA|nr:hypothetical protein Pmani_030902 [Petrolisthes manimaculis]